MTTDKEVPTFPIPSDDPLFTPEGVAFILAWLKSFKFKGVQKE